MAVLADCRHYIMQTVRSGEKLERCRVNANESVPFACPEGCVFYEPALDVVSGLDGEPVTLTRRDPWR